MLWILSQLPAYQEYHRFACRSSASKMCSKSSPSLPSPQILLKFSEIYARGAHAIAHWFLEIFSSKFHTRYLHVRLHLADMLKNVLRTFWNGQPRFPVDFHESSGPDQENFDMAAGSKCWDVILRMFQERTCHIFQDDVKTRFYALDTLTTPSRSRVPSFCVQEQRDWFWLASSPWAIFREKMWCDIFFQYGQPAHIWWR